MIPFFDSVQFTIPIIDLPIHGFGIMIALGLWFGTNMAMDKAHKDGLDPDIINRVLNWMIAGIFVGGHLGHALFYEPYKAFGGVDPNGTYVEGELIYLLKFWDGLSSFGGFIITSFLCWVFFKKENQRVKKENKERQKNNESTEEKKSLLFPIRVLHYGDCVIYGFPMAFGFGRIGCFLAHDHPGKITDFFLGVKGICRHNAQGVYDSSLWGTTTACHDLGFYEAIWACSLIPIVYFINKSKPRFPGFFLAFIPMYYGPVRFCFDYLRTNDVRYFGLTPAQYGALLLFTIGAAVLAFNYKKTPVKILTEKSDRIPF
jgi:phosphatidylglycerol:prolipoprotein diacylglycerol transferase